MTRRLQCPDVPGRDMLQCRCFTEAGRMSFGFQYASEVPVNCTVRTSRLCIGYPSDRLLLRLIIEPGTSLGLLDTNCTPVNATDWQLIPHPLAGTGQTTNQECASTSSRVSIHQQLQVPGCEFWQTFCQSFYPCVFWSGPRETRLVSIR